MDSKRQPLHVLHTNNERFAIIAAPQQLFSGQTLRRKNGQVCLFFVQIKQFQVFSNPKPALDHAATLRRALYATYARLDSSHPCQMTGTERKIQGSRVFAGSSGRFRSVVARAICAHPPSMFACAFPFKLR